jgi:hypothetical protein
MTIAVLHDFCHHLHIRHESFRRQFRLEMRLSPEGSRHLKLFFFFNLNYETIGTAATPGLLCQPRVIMTMIVESMMECRLAGETEVLGENLPQRHFCPSQNITCPPGFEPGPPCWEAGD